MSQRRSYRRPAIIASLVLHAMLAVVLLFWYLPENVTPTRADSVVTAAAAENEPASEATIPPPAQPADVPPEQIKRSIESQIEQVDALSDERKLSELEQNLRRLESVSSTESLEEVTSTIASTLGVDPHQYFDKPPAEGPFDHNTAQLQDVIRIKDASGTWKYESILVDAQGRKSQVPMSSAEGKTVYDTFQLMKQFPLAEGIYRGVVMPLIQKTIEAEALAKQTQRNQSVVDGEPSTTDGP